MNQKNKQHIHTSIRVLQFVMLGLGLIIMGRIVQLQIIDHEKYVPISQENSLRKETVLPARGLIYDRTGKLLVDNQPIYTITITPSKFESEKIPLLSRLIDVPDSTVRSRVREAQKYSWHRPSRLFTEVDFEVFSRVQENIWRLPGIGHQINSKRHYPTDLKISHVLGYLREASKREYESSKNLHLGEQVGKSGLEQVYGNYLRGEDGVEYVRVNALGQSVSSYDKGNLNKPPQKGNNLVTTLDADLQQTAETLMEGKIGGVIALDPDDGSILSMVSAPQYDIRKLSGKIDTAYWNKINSDTTDPLYNRTVSSKKPPGSTFKPLMALIGLKLGLITPETVVHCDGAYYRGRAYKCIKAHGDQVLLEAIKNSCNTYFFSLMNKIAVNGHLNKWHQMLNEIGLDRTNNIDLPNEARGIIPDSSYLNRAFGENRWGIGELISLGVGQGLVSVSPLQMSVVASAIANGGYRIQPHIVRSIRHNNGDIQHTSVEKEKVSWIEPDHLTLVRKGMRKVVTEGGGRWYANLDSIAVAGKTGTAQNPHGKDHSWFIAFAPVDDPEIAIAVLIENAGYGSLTAAPIASLLIEKYLTGDIKRDWIYQKMLNFTYQDSIRALNDE